MEFDDPGARLGVAFFWALFAFISASHLSNSTISSRKSSALRLMLAWRSKMAFPLLILGVQSGGCPKGVFVVKCSGIDQEKRGIGPVPYLLENSQETIGIFFMVGVMVGEGSVRGEGLWLLQRIGKGKKREHCCIFKLGYWKLN
jgi:hypothetical protein